MKTIADYDREINENPNDAEAYNNRGITHRNKGNYEQAVSDLTKSIEINPNNFEPYYNRGLAYMDMEEEEEALDDFSKVIELVPENAEAFAKRGYINSELGNDEDAINDYENFLRLDPSNKNAKLVRDELEKLKYGEDVFKVKKEIKKINVCSIIFGIIGTIIGINILIASGSEALGGVFAAIWFGIGFGCGIYSLFESFGLFPFVFKKDGFVEACKIAFGGGALVFVLFTIAGPLGWLIKVVKRKGEINKLKNK